MGNKGIYRFFFLAAVFLSSVCQIILKKNAGKEYKNRIREYMNLPVAAAYSLFFLSTLLTLTAYKYVPLSMGPILEATGYVWVAGLVAVFLKEKLNRQKLMGLMLIITGMIVFNWGMFG